VTKPTIAELRERVRGEVISRDDPGYEEARKARPGRQRDQHQWVRDFYEASAAHAEEGGYINFMAEDDQGRIKANYRRNYQRLVEIKRKYDPGNLFHLNQNIKP